MKKIIFFSAVLMMVIAASTLFFNQPRFFANSEHLSRFFNLPSEVDNSFIVLDKIYSQGKDGRFGMGSDNYWLRIVDKPHSLGQIMLSAGGHQTDSLYCITIIRDDIEGTFIVHKYDDKGHLRFSKIDKY